MRENGIECYKNRKSALDIMTILGIHDAHDAGAGIVRSGKVVGAVNEERFTKMKNDVGFPSHSVRYMREMLDGDEEISKIAIPWIGGSALFARIFPQLEVKRRKLWRREIAKPSRVSMSLRNIVFKTVQDQKPSWFWNNTGRSIGTSLISNRLKRIGLDKKLVFIDHHTAHASGGYYASGFKEALVLTLDGAGDGLSGSVSIGDNGELKRIKEFKASASLGILYGAATIACDMRYSEDEGKLMSLAAYSYPENIKELGSISRFDDKTGELVGNSGSKFEFLLAEYLKDNILWKYNRESFAYAVQKHVEEEVLRMVRHYIKETNIRNVVVSGGLFSNVIVNMKINAMPEVENFFVFPQMGDGGLAIGAAYYVDFIENGKVERKQIDSISYGPSYTDTQIEETLKRHREKLEYEFTDDVAKYAADKMIDDDEVVLWFQGRMEYGPRALGNRSILSLAGNNENRHRINLLVKRRPYYQPFASSMLEEEAEKLLEPYRNGTKFMTIGYKVRDEYFKDLVAASHIDGTTRPQMLGEENREYRKLIQHIKNRTGIGAVLNTSLNKHGRPIAMTPDDAVWTLLNTGATTLAIGNYMVGKKK